jgi:hypothetical protein
MNTNVITRRRLGARAWLSLLPGALGLALLVHAGGLVAQNNDNGGVLPGSFGGSPNTAQGSDSILAVHGQVEGFEVDGLQAVLAVSSSGIAPVGVASGVSEEDAEFTSTSALVAEQAESGALLLQGAGHLNPQIGLHLHMQAATTAMARAVLLVADDGSQPLETLLAGGVAPFAVIGLGDLHQLDLQTLDHLLTKHGAADPAFRVTVVFASADVFGTVHLAAVSGFTGGGALELAYQQ